MGYCQVGSNDTYDDSMNLRNILWLAPLPSNSSKGWEAPGVLVVLDGRPDRIIYRDIISEYVNFARTLYEDDFGEVAVDVNYLVGGAIWARRISSNAIGMISDYMKRWFILVCSGGKFAWRAK